ncbi:hypothetical protein CALCODRAFT_529498 [Calocera cornea HHB12733]|uniref:Uncharacterized protein n=1 Tax=Calocera cornea HHB12733 TaxID=1353952 RepID=A0A165IXW2_9BASI|nr:hypothetical protein CALCODRAFT_540014 [Calocera cornea HHB12733]KZT61114.1 hypothetical protein CALCODRAFT_529498 [Calocera cornea HHB12733]
MMHIEVLYCTKQVLDTSCVIERRLCLVQSIYNRLANPSSSRSSPVITGTMSRETFNTRRGSRST